MKRFRLVSDSFIDQNGALRSKQQFVEADSFDEVIQEIESNAGWYTGINAAFKVAYIEEVVE